MSFSKFEEGKDPPVYVEPSPVLEENVHELPEYQEFPPLSGRRDSELAIQIHNEVAGRTALLEKLKGQIRALLPIPQPRDHLYIFEDLKELSRQRQHLRFLETVVANSKRNPQLDLALT